MLRYLVENAGRLVLKEDLFEAVWPNVQVSDDTLVQCIRELSSSAQWRMLPAGFVQSIRSSPSLIKDEGD